MVGVITLVLTLVLSLAAVLALAAQGERTVKWGRWLAVAAAVLVLTASLSLWFLIAYNLCIPIILLVDKLRIGEPEEPVEV